MNSNKREAACSAVLSSAGLATTPHAVRWAQREIFGRYEMQYSKWHWTTDASHTICGRPIQLIADGPALLPETCDDQTKVTCKRCRALLVANAELSGATLAQVASTEELGRR